MLKVIWAQHHQLLLHLGFTSRIKRSIWWTPSLAVIAAKGERLASSVGSCRARLLASPSGSHRLRSSRCLPAEGCRGMPCRRAAPP